MWDPYLGTTGSAGYAPYMQELWQADYKVNPSIWDFTAGWIPSQYATGCLLDSYDMPNPYTVICHLRNDVYYQNIAPANGRQFTSADVVAHYDRILGLGNGYTIVSPYFASTSGWYPLLSVVANDKFTVTFNWKQGTNPLSILTIMQANGSDDQIECPEAVTQWGNLYDWHHAVGTGPFMLADFVDSSSVTYKANPNYWGKDLRWPQNKLPYISGYQFLIIANTATAEAAFRVGKLDVFGSMPVPDALNMIKTNPEVVVKQVPRGDELSLDPRNDVAPFNNINVRIALQHAINIPLIASSYYQGYATPWPASLTENQMGVGGWGCAYPDWPQSTKDEYTFDTTLSKKMLADAGVAGLKTDLVLESDADLDLYNIVQSELADVGITMSTQLMSSASWQSYVMTSHKYDALCARNQGILGFNFDIFRQFMRFTPGYQANYILVNDPVMTKFNNDALAAQSIDAVKQLLHDANLYAATQHFAISLAQPSLFNMAQPWIKGNPGGQVLGNNRLGYPAIVWLDQNLKKSFGH